jgi:3-hydroxybutyryl-CoA dehydrogenase/5-formyl-3-hydroxy-2-methylpyridine 4-carboxylate dehydrogenase
MVGMHWSNPPHIIPMIEVIGGEQTAPETGQAIRELIRSLGLLPVVVKKDVPGFVETACSTHSCVRRSTSGSAA